MSSMMGSLDLPPTSVSSSPFVTRQELLSLLRKGPCPDLIKTTSGQLHYLLVGFQSRSSRGAVSSGCLPCILPPTQSTRIRQGTQRHERNQKCQ